MEFKLNNPTENEKILLEYIKCLQDIIIKQNVATKQDFEALTAYVDLVNGGSETNAGQIYDLTERVNALEKE